MKLHSHVMMVQLPRSYPVSLPVTWYPIIKRTMRTAVIQCSAFSIATNMQRTAPILAYFGEQPQPKPIAATAKLSPTGICATSFPHIYHLQLMEDEMSHGTHITVKSKSDPTYCKQWSGVSYAPHCEYGCTCPIHNEPLHLEGVDTHYCPICDDFKSPSDDCKNR